MSPPCRREWWLDVWEWKNMGKWDVKGYNLIIYICVFGYNGNQIITYIYIIVIHNGI
jgi:hypothetical protein